MKKKETLTRIAVVQTQLIEVDKTEKRLNPYCPEFSANYFIKKVKKPNVEKQCARLEMAGKNKSDIVVLTESTEAAWCETAADRPEARVKICGPVPGETSEAYGRIAKKYNMHVVADVSEKDGGKYYNTAVLIGRNGELIGKYRKVHLPPLDGADRTGGDSYPVFDTDFGRVGMLVCYDWIFPEAMASLACNGPDLVCVPTQGYGRTEDLGEATVKCRAADHSVNVALSMIANVFRPGRSCIVNRAGQILADAGYSLDTIIYADMDVKAPRYDNYFPDVKTPDLGGRLFVSRHPETYKILTDENPPAYKMHLKQKQVIEWNTREYRLSVAHKFWGYDPKTGKIQI